MMIFYEPRNGHGLPHDPFNAIVGPRPIGWVSTKSAAGILNLAPYSFFNAFNYVPPIIGFSSVGAKDSLRNVQETGEFVWNLVTQPQVEAMNQTCMAVAPEVNEFDIAGLSTAPSRLIKVPRVAQSPVSFECKCTQILQMKNLQGESIETWMVFGEVIGVHIEERLISDGIYDTANAQHVMRGGGPADYFSIGPDQLFKIYRPK
jgi:flavin reductase (DIM6/NTAB) family NADH-FMN oxidoreductase RutF